MVRLIVIFAASKQKAETRMETEKRDIIISAAQKRFGLYGAEKTSMREIGDDLKISKAALYYYFPDKESLYKAVIEKEHNEFTRILSERIIRESGPEQLLRDYVTSRLTYFRSLLNLSRIRLESYSDLKPVFRETLQSFREKEKDILKVIFTKGTKAGVFHIEDTDGTALLFLDLLKGLRMSIINNKPTLTIDEEEYETLLAKTLAFTEIFIRGLKYNY